MPDRQVTVTLDREEAEALQRRERLNDEDQNWGEAEERGIAKLRTALQEDEGEECDCVRWSDPSWPGCPIHGTHGPCPAQPSGEEGEGEPWPMVEMHRCDAWTVEHVRNPHIRLAFEHEPGAQFETYVPASSLHPHDQEAPHATSLREIERAEEEACTCSEGLPHDEPYGDYTTLGCPIHGKLAPQVSSGDGELRDRAELLLTALLEILPVEGSWTRGYRVSERFDSTVRAQPEQWATAAQHFCEVHELIRRQPVPSTLTDEERERLKPVELARALGIQLWTPVYAKGKGVGMKKTDDGFYVDLGAIAPFLRTLAGKEQADD